MRDSEIILDASNYLDGWSWHHIPLARIRKTVDKLPITKDGVSVVPMVDTVWMKYQDKVFECSVWLDSHNVTCKEVFVWKVGGISLTYKSVPVATCYSTKDLACGQ